MQFKDNILQLFGYWMISSDKSTRKEESVKFTD